MAVAFSLALDELLCSPQATTHPIYESGLNLIRQSFFLCICACYIAFNYSTRSMGTRTLGKLFPLLRYKAKGSNMLS